MSKFFRRRACKSVEEVIDMSVDLKKLDSFEKVQFSHDETC